MGKGRDEQGMGWERKGMSKGGEKDGKRMGKGREMEGEIEGGKEKHVGEGKNVRVS